MVEMSHHTPTAIVDTYKLITNLKARGFTEEQAQGVTEAINEIDLSHLATKADIAELKAEIRTTSSELKADIFKWIVPLLLGQAGLITALVKLI
jgi:hypothetical protein